jgi:hypothetical protein
LSIDEWRSGCAYVFIVANLGGCRSALIDAKCKSDHLHRELMSANRRRSILIDELEGSQKTMEHANEQRFR